MNDPDAILARMRDDRESDWPTRLVSAIVAADEPLTLRERQVIECASYGMTEQMTADALGLVQGTVCNYRDSARLRLGAKNTPHAVALALRAGLIA